MTFSLSQNSINKLSGVHPDLVKVVKLAILMTDTDFSVLEGLRTIERQQMLFKSGASHTMKSRHLTGHAVDLGAFVSGEIRWDWPLYGKIAAAMKQAAKQLNIPIEWGGDWESFRDGPHYQLPFKEYP